MILSAPPTVLLVDYSGRNNIKRKEMKEKGCGLTVYDYELTHNEYFLATWG